MTHIIRTLNLSSRVGAKGASFASASTKRCLATSSSPQMPYKPEERLPMTDHQKKLYPQVDQEFTDEGYPILKVISRKRSIFEVRKPFVNRHRARPMSVAREEKMDEKQDWPSIWPTAKTYSPSAVPLPLRQSYEEPGKVARGRYCNTELPKVANFLHLTPKAIERHCNALMKFCTTWPEGLDSDEEVRSHFPVTYVTRDYVHSSTTIRDFRSRTVHLKLNVDDLKMNERDRDKFIRLAAHRYDAKTGTLTITISSCPSKVQNKDYGDYLLTALYFESLKHEKWEDDKPECDWERFYWSNSESRIKAKTYRATFHPDIQDEVYEKGVGDDVVETYKKSLEKVYVDENIENLEAYKQSVEKLLGLVDSNQTEATTK